MYTKILITICLIQGIIAVFPSPFMMDPSYANIGIANKQMGMSQGMMKKSVLAAKNEMKLKVDALKLVAESVPAGTDCPATNDVTEIENELLTAFDECNMKTQIQSLRFQAFAFKQQFAALKMAKKSCKMDLDPATCMADASANANEEINKVSGDLTSGIGDLSTQSNECIANVKEGLQLKIDAANEALLLC